jgi:glycosyltransferase involved in cell wall biosynthesis
LNSNPLVSVIIPAFNAQDLIGETLESILGQTYRNFEIIVVDDGSTDKTSQVVQGYGSSVHYFYRRNSGGYAAVPRNTGINHSSGDFLCFMDADDLMVPDRLAHQLAFMECHPEIDLVFSDYRNFNEDGPWPETHFQTCPRLWPQLRGKKDLILDNPCALLARENFGITGTFMMRRSLLKFESSFDPALRACEDFHFYYRLARHTAVGIANEVGMMRRIHGNNMTGDAVKMLSEGILSRIMLKSTEQDAVIRGYFDRHIAECCRFLARCHANNGQYLDALQKDWEALFHNVSLSGTRAFCRNVARTILIAAGLHEEKDQG